MPSLCADVAQLVEQRIRNAKVTSSIPVIGTNHISARPFFGMAFLLSDVRVVASQQGSELRLPSLHMFPVLQRMLAFHQPASWLADRLGFQLDQSSSSGIPPYLLR